MIDVHCPFRKHVSRPVIFLTNDDGIEADGLLALVKGLHSRGHPLVVVAPASEQSASGMHLSLRKNLKFEEREDLAKEFREKDGPILRMFSLDGTPCDCVIVALDGGLENWVPGLKPAICVSGINQGPNLSVDVMHSGTVSAAREAGLYGMPSIATSLSTYNHSDFSDTVEATIEIIEASLSILPNKAINVLRPLGSNRPYNSKTDNDRIIEAFSLGNLMLNINAPENWTSGFQTVSLGVRWYHNAIELANSKTGYGFKAARIIDEDIPGTDCNAVNEGSVAITPLSCWPNNHPLGLSESLLKSATKQGEYGFPIWLS